MIVHIPSTAASELSAALWGLAKPAHLRSADDTQEMFIHITDTENKRWLVVDTTYEILVHPEAVLDGIADILLGAGITQAEVDALEELVISQRGQTLTPWQYFPQPFKDMSKTREQMIAAGLLAEPETP